MRIVSQLQNFAYTSGMKRNAWPTVLSSLAAIWTLAGCQAANRFVGAWEAEINQFGQSGKTIQTMYPDGTFSGEVTARVGTEDMKVSVDGTWTSPDDKTLTLTQKNITISGLPKEIEALAKPQIEAQKDKPQTLTITWSGNDEFTASGSQGAGSITFKRKK